MLNSQPLLRCWRTMRLTLESCMRLSDRAVCRYYADSWAQVYRRLPMCRQKVTPYSYFSIGWAREYDTGGEHVLREIAYITAFGKASAVAR